MTIEGGEPTTDGMNLTVNPISTGQAAADLADLDHLARGIFPDQAPPFYRKLKAEHHYTMDRPRLLPSRSLRPGSARIRQEARYGRLIATQFPEKHWTRVPQLNASLAYDPACEQRKQRWSK
jgi:hypothetical protein